MILILDSRLKMNRKFINSFLALFCLALTAGFAFFGFPVSNAQTVNRNPQTKITPTPAPTIKIAPGEPSASPTVSPTPEEDEVIRVETELVNLNVRVVDRNNRPINNITQS